MSGARLMNNVVLGSPVNVSPFIRFCRWGLLFAGVSYGFMRQRQITRKHIIRRQKEFDKETAAILSANKIKHVKDMEQLKDLSEILKVDKALLGHTDEGYKPKYK